MALLNKDRIEALSVPITATIRQTMQAINQGAVGLALLIDPETLCFKGLVTDGDIRRGLLDGLGLESSIELVPRPEPIVAPSDMSSEKVAQLFTDQVRMIPILDVDGKVADLAFFERRLHLPVAAPLLGERELLYVTECVLTGWVSSAGKFVTRFEELFADFCDTQYAIATSNGTTALHLALLALDIGPGDEVIVPSLTFIATANAVTYTGAKVVFVDSEPETWNIDPKAVEDAITPQTKAIIAVHLYGHPAHMDPILEVAKRHKIAVVEDAAEAHGATYKGVPVGGIGDLGVFSFYGNKIVTTGEGGMVVTNRPELVDKIRMLRDHGMSKERRYYHPVVGYNYRMTNLQAALGVAQMEEIDRILGVRKQLARAYTEGLKDLPGLALPPKASWAEPVCWLYSVLIDSDAFGASRDEVVDGLQHQQIETRPLFVPIHEQPIYASNKTFPVAKRLSEQGLSLPSALGLSDEDIARAIQAIRNMGS